ncbi:pyridoxal phosphate-dependent decarboxylase family protein [Aquimarina litoralis]|uniref:pyridoxal phosphate-dependent decarboxylase family protein n=1 Tax=Aquimarina litoralis TaxID=584605 RepID=UPI001C599F41|nr:aminotransferase class I/II-fold pyridoxal phosphate-dependent enzyme [Aquimarina litoralis]MBW1296988.1 aminotransferase class I/II-fold pyridoxal phosphate-dependent enzyme [Aquimarina litoralis]
MNSKEKVFLDESLKKVYNPTDFREIGHQLVDMLADHLEHVQTDSDSPVIRFKDPEEELSYWKDDMSSETNMMDFYKKILDRSIHVHHPGYMGHQVAVPSVISSLYGLMTDVLSNGTGVYEMGMASNALERIVTEFVAKKIGYDTNASGFLTSGGTLANLTALLAARRAKAPNLVWEEGHQEKLAVLVSEEAHYCIDRAARILGFGKEGIIKVPTNESFQIDVSVLQEHLDQAKQNGLVVIALVGCASSTSTGSYDDLNALANFAEEHNLWFHVDGAHGGGVVFSEKYKHLATGIEKADSVVIDFHKMLLTPSLNTALLFKQSEDSYKTFEQRAQYLWDSQQSREWYNSGKRTFECTKLMMSLKVYAILRMYGEDIFEKNIDRLYDLGRVFAQILKNRAGFELLLMPEANIVNFRYVNLPNKDVNAYNSKIREALLKSGKFYIVQTMIGDQRYLRISIMNPLSTENDFEALLDEIENIAQTF